MKIAIFGTGGVGGYFGARLAAAGEDVHFVARGAHLDAIKQNGLKVKSALGDITIDPAQASDSPADIGPADIAMVSVKLYDTKSAAMAMKPLVGPDTTVVSFQNGVCARDVFSQAFGADRVIGGTTSIAAVIEAPGVIAHTGTMASIAFGEWDGRKSPRTDALLAAFARAGTDVSVPNNINGAIWSKFVFLAAFSGITSYFRLPIGPIMADEEKRAMFKAAMAETFAVARASGVDLADDLVEKRMAFADGLPEEMYSSMYHDFSAGKRIEVKWLSGAVVEMGEGLGIDTPTHRIFLDALLPFSEGV